MGHILNMADYRPAPQPARSEEPVYYCTHCNSERFHLHPTGQIRCAHCGFNMGNLEVIERLGNAFPPSA